VGTEARRVETEEANDARLESFRLREMPERFLRDRPISKEFERGEGVEEKIGCPTNYYGARTRTKTHCAREFFLEEEGEWMGNPSSPTERRDTICLP